jgi:ABC-type antimicrobial peptide transport system permease subunit
VRVALGARREHIVRLVAGEGIGLSAAGLAAGAAGTLAAGRFLQAYLFNVKPADVSVFAGVGAVFLVATALALLNPLRRALGVNVVEALKTE